MRVISSKRKDGHTLSMIKALRKYPKHTIIVNEFRVKYQKDVNGVEHLVTQHRDGNILSVERIED